MGKRLHQAIYKYKVLSLTALLCALPTVLISQIAISDADRFDLSFSTTHTSSAQQNLTISLSDLDVVAGHSFSYEVINSGKDVQTELSQYPAIRNVRSGDLSENTYLHIPFRNTTSADFQGMMVAFDFLYDSRYEDSAVLQLYVQVQDNKPIAVSGARIATDNLQFSDSGWNTFSLQFSIDDIYLKRNKLIDFIWLMEDQTSTLGDLPLALQQIEINPVRSTVVAPRAGSVVITEILASYDNEQPLEFIELYNQTENSISLKGVEVITSRGSFIVQKDVILEPYSFAVLSNKNIAELPGDVPLYQYARQIIPSGSGFVELYQDGMDMTRASYSIDNANRSVELTRTTSATGGFSAAQSYSQSENEFESQLYGTPGKAGTTTRAFSRELPSFGYSVITIPGLVSETRNNLRNRELYLPDGEEVNSDLIVPFMPLIVRSDRSESTGRLVVEEVPRSTIEGEMLNIDYNTSLLSLPTVKQINFGQIAKVSGESVSPVAMRWSAEEQRFKLIQDPLESLDYWSALIVNRNVAEPLVVREDGMTAGGPILERFIRFRLFEEGSNRRERMMDDNMIGFIRQDRLQRDNRFDLPVYLPFFDVEDDDKSVTLMHTANPESNIRANKFTHLPFDLDRVYTFTLGVSSTENSITGVLEWSQMEDIPDEWVLTIEDRFTGLKVDMREESRLRFRYSFRTPIDFDDHSENSFNTVRPSEEERFAVTLKPYESVLETEDEDTRPSTIELRQNYPNPFNPTTNIVYYLPEDSQVRIGVYNVVGQPVGILVDDNVNAGEHTVTWNATEFPSGIYIVQLETANRIFTRKITLIK